MDEQSLHILVVEDNPTDVFLLKKTLEEVKSLKIVLTQAKRLDEALQHLSDKSFDVVLLDLGLPDSQGLETFNRVQRDHSKSPILILSGLDNESLSVQAVQDGAQDFLVKGRINGKALTRTMLYAIERKRSQQRLIASEAGYRRLFETAGDGIILLDANSGQITDANPYLEELLGYSRAEFIGKRLWEIAPFRDKAANHVAFRTLQEKGYIRYDDVPLTSKTGRFIDVEFVSNVYEVGNQRVIQCNIRDITERKRAEVAKEESQRFLQSTLDALSSHIAVLDEKGEIVAVNKAWEGFAEENEGTAVTCGVGANYLGVCARSEGAGADAAAAFYEGIRAVIAGRQQKFSRENPCHSPTEKRWFNVSVTRFIGEGPVRVVVAHEDITAQKLAENLISASEANLAKSQQMAHLGSWELDLANIEDVNSNPLHWSDEAFRIFGYEPGQIEASNDNFFRAVHPDDYERVSTAITEALRDGKSYSLDHRVLWPGGEERIVHEQANIVFDEWAGKPLRMVGTVQDITERKQTEKALQKNEAKFRTIFETALDAILLANDDGVYLDANPAACTLLGLEHEQLVGRSVTDFVSPAQRDAVHLAWEDFLREGQQSGEFEFQQPDGTPRQAEFRAVAGLQSGVHISILRDITERKQAEATLLESEVRFRTAISEAPVPIMIHREDGKVLQISKGWTKYSGYALEDVPTIQDWVERSYGEVSAEAHEYIKALYQIEQTRSEGQWTITAKNGQKRVWDFTTTPLGTFGDNQRVVINTAFDITEREQAKEALEERTGEIVTIWESMTDAFFTLDTQWHFTYINPQAAILWHRNTEELIGKSIWEVFPATVDSNVYREYHRAVEEQVIVSFEAFYAPHNVWRDVHAYPSKLGLSVYFHDITERKQAEALLVENQQRLALATESAQIGIWDWDVVANKMMWDARMFALYGVREQDFSGAVDAWQNGLHPEDRDQAEVDLTDALDGSRDFHPQFRVIWPNGEVHWIEASAIVQRADDGTALRMIGVNWDITKRKQAEAQLHFQKTLLEAQTEASPDGILVVDGGEQKKILSYNQRLVQMWNIPPDVVASGDDAALREAILSQVVNREELAKRVKYIYEHPAEHTHEEIQLLGGQIFERYSAPINDAEGSHFGRVWFFRDITEFKQAENTLRASEARFQSIVANVPGMVYQFVLQPDGSIEWPFVSEGCRDLYEVEPEFIQANPNFPIEVIHPDDIESFNRTVMESVETLLPWRWEGRHRARSGKITWLQGLARPQRLLGGGTLWDGVVTDITARKEAEAERDRFFTLSLDMLAIIGSDGYFKRLNPAWEVTLGFSNAEIMSVPFLEFVHPDDRAATIEEDAKLVRGSDLMRLENRYRCRDGSYKWLLWMCASFEDLIYCVAHDITSIKEAEAALQQANDELEMRVTERTAELGTANESLRVENIQHQMTMDTLREVAEALQQAKQEADIANLAKSEFLSRMSHELRTPLNAILGFGQILEMVDWNANSQQLENVQQILKAGRHLLGLINEVLDIARVEAGHLELSIEPIALADIVPDACALMRPLAAQRQIRLDANLAELGRNYVLADRQRLKQVLINLLANAIKYNRDGGQVEVSCNPKSDGWISIAVRDTGVGMSPVDLAKLFTPFERLNASTTEIEGTGLGLVLSQRLVTAMGGTLSVESTLSQGSTFTIDLPQTDSPEEQGANMPHAPLLANAGQEIERAYSVLCIEDNPSNLRLMETIFQMRPKVQLLTAIQGSIGIDLARQHEPDLILLDLNLPDIHGSEVLARLKQSALTRDIPVVVVSADATPNQVERLLSAGARDYLTKPVDVGQLLHVVDGFWGALEQ